MTTRAQRKSRSDDTERAGPRQETDGGHFSVLLREAVAALAPRAGGRYLDGTFGGGGHTSALLAIEPGIGRLFALDADPAAVDRARRLADEALGRDRLVPLHGNFGDIAEIAQRDGVRDLDGILLDLGVSSFQLDQAERGFSFRFDAPLDMRFDPERGPSAADLVRSLDQEELAALIWRYGDERQSRRIAGAIVQARSEAPIETTLQLSSLVSDTLGGRRGKGIHPATRTFQALRIAVNQELDALDRVLAASTSLLAPGGRLVVISFHSLEDRAVKRFMERELATCICPPEQPVCTCAHQPTLQRIGKPVRPSASELDANPRSRSAIMRVAERLPIAAASTGRTESEMEA